MGPRPPRLGAQRILTDLSAVNQRQQFLSFLRHERLITAGDRVRIWDRATGKPIYNAIVWQDTRTDQIAAALERSGKGDVIRKKAGLPPATYFSGGKVQWILENVDGVREAAERGEAVFGNIDTWCIWNLTGGVDGGSHVTDVTNASRTMLMDLETLDWDDERILAK